MQIPNPVAGNVMNTQAQTIGAEMNVDSGQWGVDGGQWTEDHRLLGQIVDRKMGAERTGRLCGGGHREDAKYAKGSGNSHPDLLGVGKHREAQRLVGSGGRDARCDDHRVDHHGRVKSKVFSLRSSVFGLQSAVCRLQSAPCLQSRCARAARAHLAIPDPR